MKINLYNYNNYFNRIKKSEATLADYEPYKVGEQIIRDSFKYADGQNTVQIVNLDKNHIGNYMILTDDNDVIDSHWFVIEATYIRGKQYQLQLKRDVIVDYKNQILNATTFIEKATLSDTDPMIYNKEPVEFNQIKKTEDLLIDETNSAWVVGYIPRETDIESALFPDTGTVEPVKVKMPAEGGEDFSANTLQEWQYYRYLNNTVKGKITKPNLYTATFKFTAPAGEVCYNVGIYGDGTNYKGTGKSNDSIQKLNTIIYNEHNYTNVISDTFYAINDATGSYDVDDLLAVANGTNNLYKPNFKDYNTNTLNQLATSVNGCMTEEEFNIYNSLRGKVLKIGTNEYYNIEIHEIEKNKSEQFNTNEILKNELNNKFNKQYAIGRSSYGFLFRDLGGNASDDTYKLYSTYNTYQMILVPLTINIESIEFGKSRYHLDDQPYDMFAIPLGNPFSTNQLKIYKYGVEQTWFKPNALLAMAFATHIGAMLGSKYVYDVQLLPYCPVRYMIREDGKFDIRDAVVNYITEQNNTDNKLGIIFWATHSSFSFNIQKSIPITEKKIQNQCDMHRLCSPNYNGLFDFNVARNNGVDYFNVDCSYKPFSPYIHINPNFKGLYGSDFNGTRGLICGGDFSLPQVTNEWANYQMNNKNYSTIFNRETEHLDTMRNIQRTQEIAGLIGGTLVGTGIGAMTGSEMFTGNYLSTGIGAAIGSTANILGGMADLSLSDKAYKENMNMRNTIHNLQLDNIKAIPDSLTKVNAFTYNNKIFPFVEYYTCTDEEKQMFRNMLKYDGMTVNRIGTIGEFLKPESTYIKGKIIRLDELNDDLHLANTIYEEIDNGIYIKGGE